MATVNKYNPLLGKGIQKLNTSIQLVSGTVDVYANLPTASLHSGEVYFCTDNSGGLLSWLGFYKYPKGLYISDGSIWEQMPLSVKFSEDALTLLNITNWSEYYAMSVDINTGDRLIFNNTIYRNKTSIQTATSPNTDTTNWELLADVEPGIVEGQLYYWDDTKKKAVPANPTRYAKYSEDGINAKVAIGNGIREISLETNGSAGNKINFNGQLELNRNGDIKFTATSSGMNFNKLAQFNSTNSSSGYFSVHGATSDDIIYCNHTQQIIFLNSNNAVGTSYQAQVVMGDGISPNVVKILGPGDFLSEGEINFGDDNFVKLSEKFDDSFFIEVADSFVKGNGTDDHFIIDFDGYIGQNLGNGNYPNFPLDLQLNNAGYTASFKGFSNNQIDGTSIILGKASGTQPTPLAVPDGHHISYGVVTWAWDGFKWVYLENRTVEAAGDLSPTNRGTIITDYKIKQNSIIKEAYLLIDEKNNVIVKNNFNVENDIKINIWDVSYMPSPLDTGDGLGLLYRLGNIALDFKADVTLPYDIHVIENTWCHLTTATRIVITPTGTGGLFRSNASTPGGSMFGDLITSNIHFALPAAKDIFDIDGAGGIQLKLGITNGGGLGTVSDFNLFTVREFTFIDFLRQLTLGGTFTVASFHIVAFTNINIIGDAFIRIEGTGLTVDIGRVQAVPIGGDSLFDLAFAGRLSGDNIFLIDAFAGLAFKSGSLTQKDPPIRINLSTKIPSSQTIGSYTMRDNLTPTSFVNVGIDLTYTSVTDLGGGILRINLASTSGLVNGQIIWLLGDVYIDKYTVNNLILNTSFEITEDYTIDSTGEIQSGWIKMSGVTIESVNNERCSQTSSNELTFANLESLTLSFIANYSAKTDGGATKDNIELCLIKTLSTGQEIIVVDSINQRELNNVLAEGAGTALVNLISGDFVSVYLRNKSSTARSIIVQKITTVLR